MGERAKCCVLALMGLPGAGKSSLARALADRGLEGAKVVHVCFDDYIDDAGAHGGEGAGQEGVSEGAAADAGGTANFDGELWKDGRRAACSKVDQVLLEHGEGRVVVLADDNMYYRSMRRPLFQLARCHGAAYVQLYVRALLASALERNVAREGLARVPDATIERMAGAMEAPAPDSHPWEAGTVHVWTDGSCREGGEGAPGVRWSAGEPVGEVASALAAAWGPAPDLVPTDEELAARREAGTAANAASIVHGLDVRSRKALSAALGAAAGLPGKEKAAAARRLNDGRKALLDRARRLGELLTEADARVLEDTFAASCASFGTGA